MQLLQRIKFVEA